MKAHLSLRVHVPIQGARPSNLPLLRALWTPLDGIWGVLKGSWGVLGGLGVSV